MSAVTTFFSCEGELNGIEAPDGWERWTMFRRSVWLRDQGVASDLLDAVRILKRAGQWWEGTTFFWWSQDKKGNINE
jgi:hypothetical protein